MFQIERVADVWSELLELHRLHWHETETYRHGQPFAPSMERYKEFEDCGWFLLFTARQGHRLVGNCGMYLCPSMHSQQLIATEDTLFLHPDFRRGRTAIEFIGYVRDECFRRGAVEVTVTAKGDKVGRLLRYLAFQPTAVQYSLAAPTARVVTPPVGESSHDAAAAELPTETSPARAAG